MPPCLTILTGSKAGAQVPLEDRPATFGRGPDRTLVFRPEEIVVSAEHAAIELRGGRWVLRDVGSTNGTFVNGERVRERVLEDGDVIQFGAGGPAGRFEMEAADGVSPTLDTGLLVQRRTQATPVSPAPAIGRRSTRELIALTLDRFASKTRRLLWGLAVVVGVVMAAGAGWQQWNRVQLERALRQLSGSLTVERASRAAMERDLSAIETRYDSLRRLLANERPGLTALRQYSRGVALIVFSFGYVEQDGNELLRYTVDARGDTVGWRGPDGRLIPGIGFGGDGPPVTREGTATGFLIDSTGLMLTNRHVAEPWNYGSDELEAMHAHGIAAEGRLTDIRAYFPPGDQSFKLVVVAMSPRADVAIMRVLGGRVRAPVVPLAVQPSVLPGDRLRLIGYPTGVYNLLFRVDDGTRREILSRVGDNSRQLVEELARRRLIQPLVTEGSVSDITGTEVIHTAVTTVGGSGGPLLDERQQVVAIQHASVLSPTRGDPFRTQRAVPIRFAWEIFNRKRR